MKRLYVCETPFQLIVSLFLIKQNFKNNVINDLIVTDDFSGAKKITSNIKKSNLFKSVYYYKKNCNNTFDKLKYLVNYKKLNKDIFGEYNDSYDEIYMWNYDSFTSTLRNSLNRKVKCFIFEEGYISYFPYKDVISRPWLLKIINIKNRFIFRKNRENIDGIYLFEPELLMYNPKCPIYKIDRTVYDLRDLSEIIDLIFESKRISKYYDKKYILFEENHPEYKDFEIFKKIINIVGKDNVIIKLHPRRFQNRFESLGVKTLGSDGVPWEAIALSKEFNDNVLISISSGSITSYRMLCGKKSQCYLLYKIESSNLKQFNLKYKSFWNNLESNIDEKGIHFPTNAKEFYDMLKEEK